MPILDYSKIKQEMTADKYRVEIEASRQAGIDGCVDKNLAVELFTGKGGLTKLYKASFKKVITNDINKSSIAEYNYPTKNFIDLILPKIDDKIDMIDFDSYESPTNDIKRFFEVRKDRDYPLVLALSDGLGLWMKMRRDISRLRQRYLLDDSFTFDERHPWREHTLLITEFLRKIGEQYGMNVSTISAIQLKFKNYTVGSWLFDKKV